MINKWREKFAGFMVGRYGADRLGQFLIGVSLFLSAAWNFHKEAMGGYSGVCVPDSLLFSDVFEEYREKV